VNTVEVRTMGDVSLSVPAKPDFLHVLRAVVSGVGARQGLSYDAINELCLAASEAAAYLLGLTPADGDATRGGRLSLRLRAESDISVTVMTDASVPMWPPPAQRTLAWRILAGLVDDVSFVLEEGCPAIRLVLSGPAQESATER
jgi:serine/threonine-protein kinase RsbW